MEYRELSRAFQRRAAAANRKWSPNRPPPLSGQLFGTLAANLHRAKQGPQGNMLGFPAFSTCNALNQGAALGLA